MCESMPGGNEVRKFRSRRSVVMPAITGFAKKSGAMKVMRLLPRSRRLNLGKTTAGKVVSAVIRAPEMARVLSFRYDCKPEKLLKSS